MVVKKLETTKQPIAHLAAKVLDDIVAILRTKFVAAPRFYDASLRKHAQFLWQTDKRELADGLLEVAEGFGTGLYNSVTTRIKPYIETLRALALVDLTYPLARAFPLLA